MAERKWTKGKWRVEGGNENLVYAPDGWIADVRAGVNGSHGAEASANAHLIAAAPQLYDALEAVRQFVNDYGPEEPPEFAGKTNDTLALIDAALSLARGESAT